MGLNLKKIGGSERASIYALTEDVDSQEWKQLNDWLDTHCPDSYLVSNMCLILERRNELFFELTFPIN